MNTLDDLLSSVWFSLIFRLVVFPLAIYFCVIRPVIKNRISSKGVRNTNPPMTEYIYRIDKSREEIRDILSLNISFEHFKSSFDPNTYILTFTEGYTVRIDYMVNITETDGGCIVRLKRLTRIIFNRTNQPYYVNPFMAENLGAVPIPFYEENPEEEKPPEPIIVKDKLRAATGAKWKCLLYTVGAVLVANAAFFHNLGWFRVILIWLLIPLQLAIGVFLINFFVLKYLPYSVALRRFNLVFNLAYIGFNLFLLDFSDNGPFYMFFRLIKDDNPLFPIGMFSCGVCFVALIVMFILQLVFIKKTKRRVVIE